MNRKLFILLIILTLLHSSYLFTEDARPPLAFSITTDATYLPESNHISGKHNHFAPFTGPFGGTEFRSTVNASYTINTPFGSSPLFSGNTLVFTGNFELSPVTILQKAKVTFTPAFPSGPCPHRPWRPCLPGPQGAPSRCLRQRWPCRLRTRARPCRRGRPTSLRPAGLSCP